jgi:hypothetical protein
MLSFRTAAPGRHWLSANSSLGKFAQLGFCGWMMLASTVIASESADPPSAVGPPVSATADTPLDVSSLTSEDQHEQVSLLLEPALALAAVPPDPLLFQAGPNRVKFSLDAVTQLSGVTGSWWNLSERFAPDANYKTDRAWAEA